MPARQETIDARVLVELSEQDLVPAIWLPGPAVRVERELARFRLHLVRQRTALENRIHASLLALGHPCPVADPEGRRLLRALEFPELWLGDVEASLRLIDQISFEISEIEDELRQDGAEHPYVPLLRSAPGVSGVLGYTIASEIGDVGPLPLSAGGAEGLYSPRRRRL